MEEEEEEDDDSSEDELVEVAMVLLELVEELELLVEVADAEVAATDEVFLPFLLAEVIGTPVAEEESSVFFESPFLVAVVSPFKILMTLSEKSAAETVEAATKVYTAICL